MVKPDQGRQAVDGIAGGEEPVVALLQRDVDTGGVPHGVCHVRGAAAAAARPAPSESANHTYNQIPGNLFSIQ